jgi:hypothetical protein
MPTSTSNLSVDEQQAIAAKRKEDDAEAAVQATAATAHREHEALIGIVAVISNTLDEAQARKRTTALA